LKPADEAIAKAANVSKGTALQLERQAAAIAQNYAKLVRQKSGTALAAKMEALAGSIADKL
jgi:hypothetical protein